MARKALLRRRPLRHDVLDLDLQDQSPELRWRSGSASSRTSRTADNGAAVIVVALDGRDPGRGRQPRLLPRRHRGQVTTSGAELARLVVQAVRLPDRLHEPRLGPRHDDRRGRARDLPRVERHRLLAGATPTGKLQRPHHVRNALGNSLNIPAFKAAQAVGVHDDRRVRRRTWASRRSTATTARRSPSAASTSRALDLAYGYSVLANGGTHARPGRRRADERRARRSTRSRSSRCSDRRGRTSSTTSTSTARDAGDRRPRTGLHGQQHPQRPDGAVHHLRLRRHQFPGTGGGEDRYQRALRPERARTPARSARPGPSATRRTSSSASGPATRTTRRFNIFSTSISFRAMRDMLLAPTRIGEATTSFAPRTSSISTSCGMANGGVACRRDLVRKTDEQKNQRTAVVDALDPGAEGGGPAGRCHRQRREPSWRRGSRQRFSSPSGSVSGSVTIRGTATAPRLAGYTVQFSGPDGAWRTIGRWSVPVANGTLAAWSTAGLPPGTYTLRLTVRDAFGATDIRDELRKQSAAAPPQRHPRLQPYRDPRPRSRGGRAPAPQVGGLRAGASWVSARLIMASRRR